MHLVFEIDQVLDDVVVVFVISIGKRERSEVYNAAQKRLR